MFTLHFFPLFLLFIKPLHDINGLWHYTGSFKTHDGVLADYVFYSEEKWKGDGREGGKEGIVRVLEQDGEVNVIHGLALAFSRENID